MIESKMKVDETRSTEAACESTSRSVTRIIVTNFLNYYFKFTFTFKLHQLLPYLPFSNQIMPKDKSGKKEHKKKDTKEVSEPPADVSEDVEMGDAEAAKVLGFSILLVCLTDSCGLLKSPKKSKKDKDEIVIPLEDLSPLAHPLAQKKLLKKLHKTIKKGNVWPVSWQKL